MRNKQEKNMGFYRKKKIGLFNIGVSTKGLGISTGIKGLRIGISSTGTPYVSAGLFGFNYRKNLTSKKKKPVKQEVAIRKDNNIISEQKEEMYIDIPKKLKNKRLIYFIIFIITTFLIFKSELFLFLSCISLILACNTSLSISFKLKKCKNFISKAKNYIADSDISSLNNLLSKLDRKLKYKELITSFYKETYSELLQKIVADNIISANESEIIDLYRNNLSETDFVEINSNGIDLIIANILSDGKITDNEKSHLDFAIKLLPLSESKTLEINILVKNLETILGLNKKGLSIIEKQEGFNGKECYYKGKITNITRHSSKGIYSFEESGISDFFVDDEFMHFINDGHKKIKINQIINTEVQNGLICFVVENRQKPIFIKTNDSLLILSIISCIQNN